MNELLKEKFFNLMVEPSQATNEEIQNAYGCFMEQVKTVSQSEQEPFGSLSDTEFYPY